MSEWKEYSIGEIAEVIGGGTPKTKIKEYWGDEIPWLTPRDLSNFTGRLISRGERNITKLGLDNSSAKLLPKGTILLSSRAPVGYLAIASNEISTNQGFRNLVPNSKVDNIFLYYLLKQNIDYLKSQATGTTFEELSGSTLKSLTFLIPPLPEQRAIAEVLSALDDKIDLLHRQNQTLEALAQTLFWQWFIEEAEDDWEEGFLPDEFDFTMGLSPPGSSYNEDSIGTPMFQGNADFTFRFPKNRVYTTDPRRYAEKFDTLISVRAPVGAQNMAFEKSCIGRGLAAFRYKNNYPYFSYTYYKLNSIITEIKQFEDSGTVFGSINKADFESIEIIIPPKKLIGKFENIVCQLDKKIYNNSNQIKTLEKLRDILLPKLMSGEIRVSARQLGEFLWID